MNELKPPARPTKIPLVQLFQGTSLTACAAEALLSEAKILSEGRVDRENDAPFYSGSTLVSIDLEARFDYGGAPQLDRLVTCARHSIFLHLGLLRLARREAERKCAPHIIREMDAETFFRAEGGRLLVDVDVECPLASVDEMEGEG